MAENNKEVSPALQRILKAVTDEINKYEGQMYNEEIPNKVSEGLNKSLKDAINAGETPKYIIDLVSKKFLSVYGGDKLTEEETKTLEDYMKVTVTPIVVNLNDE